EPEQFPGRKQCAVLAFPRVTSLPPSDSVSLLCSCLMDVCLFPELFGEIASHLVSPHDYMAFARTSTSVFAALTGQSVWWAQMDQRYFDDWRRVQHNGVALEHVEEQTHELCLAAVQQDGRALQFVKEQTHDLCLVAVQQDGWILKYVKKQTPEL